MSNFEKIQNQITEYKQILQFIFLIIKENFPLVIIYLILQIPLFIFGNYLSNIDFIFKCIAWQIWLGVFLFIFYFGFFFFAICYFGYVMYSGLKLIGR